MLVLSRKPLESILIDVGGRLIEVVLIKSKGGRARIGINAPLDVKIIRKEIADLPANPKPKDVA